MTPVYFSPEAEDDLRDIWTYIAQFDNVAADRMVDRIHAVRRRLEIFPSSGTPRPDFGTNLRSIAVRPYTVVYRVAADAVEVARVIHGARDVESEVRSER